MANRILGKLVLSQSDHGGFCELGFAVYGLWFTASRRP